MVGSELLELDPSEKMHVGRMGREIGQGEGNLRTGNCLILLRIVDEALLREITASSAPSCPEAELEEADRQGGRGDRPDDTDKGLLAADFCAHILAEDRRLEVG